MYLIICDHFNVGELNEAQKQLVDARKEVDSLRMRLAEALESAAEPTTPVSTPPGNYSGSLKFNFLFVNVQLM